MHLINKLITVTIFQIVTFFHLLKLEGNLIPYRDFQI
jgi:hypothetical protein